MGNDSTLIAATATIVGLLAYIAAFAAFIKTYAWAAKGLGAMGRAVQGGMARIANTAGRAGKKAAMNSKYGQAAQQFMGNRKSIAALKGREALRGTLEKNPNLMKLMGGAGGGKYAARYLDAEQRKHRAEDVSNLQQGLTGNVAGYGIATGGRGINKAMQEGFWRNADGSRARDVTDADRASLAKLKSEGYMDDNFNLKKTDPRLANAALGSIMEAEIATPDNVGQLAGMLRGAGEKENALFTENLQRQAAAHKYKNIQYDDVSDGQVRRYYIKSGGQQVLPDGTLETPEQAAARGANKVLESGLRGLNKDALDAGMDKSLLNAIQRKMDSLTTDEDRKAFTIKIADQTRDSVEKGPIVAELAKRLGTDANTFTQIQVSLRTGGASGMPVGYGPAAPSTPSTPAPTPATPPPPSYQQAPGSPLIVPHSPPRASRPRPGDNFNGPTGGSPGGGINT